MKGPLLTLQVHEALCAAARTKVPTLRCSLDLDRSTTTVEADAAGWTWNGRRFPYLETCRDRTVYHWLDGTFQPVARFGSSLIKLVPTQWGPPTFEIDGIKMLATAHVSPWLDAERKVALIRPSGKVILDTCGGLGYFASACLLGRALRVLSHEKNPDVIWLRGLNPWSPETGGALELTQGDIAEEIVRLPDGSVDAILHDPPRFGIAGELYSRTFYEQLSRVIKRKGSLYHYTGAPNKVASGRDMRREVADRLRQAGFATRLIADGVLAERNRRAL